jgi:hypothetical protein
MTDTPTQEPQPVWAELGLDKEAFDRFPPETRLTLERTHHPKPPVQRRPTKRLLTPEELETLAGLPWDQYYTKGRELQQSPPPEPSPDET